MANDNKEIGEIVKKCKILLLDIEGTTTSISFVKDKLFPYAEENVKQFLDSQWEKDDVKEAVAALRKLALEDQEKSVDGVVVIPGEDASKEDQIEGLVNNVKWQMSSDRKEGALKQLQGLIWKQGYDSGDIKGHVYDDVSGALEQWHSVDGQKVYIYSSGSVQAQKLLFGQSLAGDLLRFIDGHFDTAVGAKQEAASYTAIAEKIGVKPADVLFLTDIPKEAEAARVAGFHVALVSREGNAPLSAEATDAFAVLHSFAQLSASNKRKTEPQDEHPAKIPKTDGDVAVKTVSESVVLEDKVSEKEVQGEQEKMEVEESIIPDVDKEKKVKETIIEDVTDIVESLDVPMAEVEPVINDVDGEKPDEHKKEDGADKKVEEIKVEATKDAKPVDIEVKPDEAKSKPESSTISDEVATKPDGVATELTEVVSKAEEIVPQPDAAITKPDEVVTIPNEVVTKAEDVVTNTEKDLVTTEVSKLEEAKDISIQAELSESKISEGAQNAESEDKLETPTDKEKIKLGNEIPTTMITEIEEITEDNLGDVAEIMDDLEPIVEEPPNEDMEDLQNVGEVLEKECDEILSKVQDVTNLDSIPMKPLLNPIVEESMETEIDAENMDSNDIVDRILDTELELEMKQCNEIDLNTFSEITDDAKIEDSVETKLIGENESVLESNSKLGQENTKEASNTPKNVDMENSQSEPNVEGKTIVTIESKKEENSATEDKSGEIESKEKNVTHDAVVCNKVEIKAKPNKQDEEQDSKKTDTKMDTNDTVVSNDLSDKTDQSDNTDKTETNNKIDEAQVPNAEESKAQPTENNKDDVKNQTPSTDTDMVSEEVTTDSEKDKESQVNGKATNGEAEIVNVNGDVSNAEELNSRLSVENGKETVNGSNGDSVDSEKGKGDTVEAEVSDIKVKTVATEEPRTDPIEQPTEA